MGMWKWRVSDDRKWTEVYDDNAELVALFRDDDAADDYVEWRVSTT